jgi:hypothetical protein
MRPAIYPTGGCASEFYDIIAADFNNVPRAAFSCLSLVSVLVRLDDGPVVAVSWR